MEYHKTIIVGGGPAGSSCAWQLQRHGEDVLIIDKQPFPRLKLCGGWISEKVMKLLDFTPEEYPHSILPIKIKLYFAPFPFPLLTNWLLPGRKDYSIRRIEFDDWLLKRSEAPFKVHQVKTIEQEGEYYVIDHQFQCKYLVGAGGTGCPVRRNLFPDQRLKIKQISAIEKELEYPQRDQITYIFFGDHGLKGYAWYVPKGNGFLNLGLGGSTSYFTQSQTNIHDHFQWFLDNLVKRQLLDEETSKNLKPSGYSYYLFTSEGEPKRKNCFLIGDSLGVASLDFAEGIRPSVESGLTAANRILTHNQYSPKNISPFSINRSFYWLEKSLGLSFIL